MGYPRAHAEEVLVYQKSNWFLSFTRNFLFLMNSLNGDDFRKRKRRWNPLKPIAKKV
jgi:hypothetical protein